MPFLVTEPKKITSKFPYWNSAAGIGKDDGVALIFRQLTADEEQEFADRTDAAISVKMARKAGRGFRDRSKDPRTQAVTYETDTVAMREIRRDRIKAALVDWEGFVDEDGSPLPYSFDNFLKACELLPDLYNFAEECIEEAAAKALKKLEELKESEKNSPTGQSSD